MISLLVYIIRCLILIFGIWFISIIIGKKSLAQLTPFDVGILMIISNVVSQPVVNKDSFKTTFGIILLSLSIIVIGKLSLNKKFYRVDYTPSILVANGVINKAQLKKNRLSIFTLMSMLRVQGYSKLADVNFVLMELGGDISVIPKNSAKPATVEDLNLQQPEDDITFPVIMDGEVFKDILPYVGIDEQWLRDELQRTYQTRPEDVFYAEADKSKTLYINRYTQSGKR